jgi:hypothetical protein
MEVNIKTDPQNMERGCVMEPSGSEYIRGTVFNFAQFVPS